MSRYFVNRRKQRRDKIKNALATTLCVVTMMAATIGALNYTAQQDYYYYVDNGHGGYEQLVDRSCEVVEINGDEITVVTNSGELYAFYGDGYKVGTTIICTFTMADEIIDAQ